MTPMTVALNLPLEKLTAYLEHIQNDYNKNTYNTGRTYDYSVGSTYVHVFSVEPNDGGKSSHSWIVNKEGHAFPLGSILKSASWKAPSRNFARGNILTGDISRARWTGVS